MSHPQQPTAFSYYTKWIIWREILHIPWKTRPQPENPKKKPQPVDVCKYPFWRSTWVSEGGGVVHKKGLDSFSAEKPKLVVALMLLQLVNKPPTGKTMLIII